MRRLLLACGVVSSALYLVTIDVVAALLYPEYHSYASQMVSELIARSSPTRWLMVAVFIPYNMLVFACARGVWLSAERGSQARLTAASLAGYGVTSSAGLLLAPMDVRSAGLTAQTFLHIWATVLQGVFILMTLALGAFLHGKAFRRFSLAVLLACVVVGGWAGVQAADSSPWIGVTERISIYLWMLWVATLAISLWRPERRP